MATKELTIAKLRELIAYDARTGLFTWSTRRRRGVRFGSVAGSLKETGYIYISILGMPRRASRLAWFYETGAWPTGHIDHINGNRSDNRICNLRDVTETVNHQNQRRPQTGNKSGYLGVYKNRRRWSARIDAHGVSHHIGTFDTPEIAHAAYLDMKRILHAGCTI